MPKEILFDEQVALKQAMELFWCKGYNATSMDELTKVTGLSRSSIYNTFGGKHELFMQTLKYYQDAQDKEMEQVVSAITSPLQKIKAVFAYAVDDVVGDKQHKGCLVVNSTTELANADDEVKRYVTQTMESKEQVFAGWVKGGQAAGEINTAFSPEALAAHLFNLYSGLKVSGKAKPDRKHLEAVVQVGLSVLERSAVGK